MPQYEYDSVTVSVSASRTIPTKPYGNEKWEFSVSVTGKGLITSQELYELSTELRIRMDIEEQAAIEHANSTGLSK